MLTIKQPSTSPRSPCCLSFVLHFNGLCCLCRRAMLCSGCQFWMPSLHHLFLDHANQSLEWHLCLASQHNSCFAICRLKIFPQAAPISHFTEDEFLYYLVSLEIMNHLCRILVRYIAAFNESDNESKMQMRG